MKPYFEIIRPFNTIFVALTILFGAFFHSQNLSLSSIIFATLSAVFISAAGYVINDIYDLKIDQINRPKRVLPSKRLSVKTAYFYTIILFLLGIIFGLLTQKLGCILIAIINSLLMFYYAKSLKKMFLVGNLVVAYAAGSSFIFGSIANSNFENVILVAIVAFLYTLIREIVKDIEDVDGDKKDHSSTLPIVLGKRIASLLTIIPILMIIYVLNYELFSANFNFFKILTNPFNYILSIPLVVLFILYINNSQSKFLHIISLIMKANMLIYLVAVWVL